MMRLFSLHGLSLLASLVALLGLTGCLGGEQEDIKRWMQEQRAATKPTVPPIPEPKRFTPEQYQNDVTIDPFSNQKLTQALKRETEKSSNAALVAPELNRRKEPLESLPLDAFAMVGTLMPKGQPIALVKANNLVHQIKVGNYLGPNYGKVIKITETDLSLREIVQDAAGEWIEKETVLQLQEQGRK